MTETYNTMRRLDAAGCDAPTYLAIAVEHRRLAAEHGALVAELLAA